MTNEHPRTALVTGSSGGIGRGIALRLAGEGYRVLVNYFRDRAGAVQTVDMIRQAGGQAICLEADVGDVEQVDRMFDRSAAEYGPMGVLVNNAGVQTWKALLELEVEEWDRTIRTNLRGTFLCTRKAAAQMQAAGAGRIINLGSGSNRIAFPRLVDYTASKGGIEMFTKVAAVELGPMGITVNCVAPGATEIERTRRESPDYAATWSAVTPLGRVAQVEDIAAAVTFLAGPEASFITGQTLFVDGGLFCRPVWPYEP